MSTAKKINLVDFLDLTLTAAIGLNHLIDHLFS